MPPLQSQMHVDQLLSNVSVKYRSAELIAEKIFPTVPVKKDSDYYRIYERNFKIPETIRANKGLAAEFTFGVTTGQYLLEKHALKDYVSDDDKDNYDISDLRADATEELTDAILRRLEKTVADLFTKTSWSLNVSLAATGLWTSNSAGSSPIALMDTAATTIIENSGFKPNFAVLPRAAYVAAKNHTSINERLKYTTKDITPVMMAGLFDVEEVLVPNAAYDTTQAGLTESMSSFFDDVAFLGYKPSSPGPRQPSCGYIFQKTSALVRRWRVEEREAEAIEVQRKYNAKVVASLAGYLMKNVV